MFDLASLPADQQEGVRREVHAMYLECGGDDIDRAVARDRKVLREHERELEYVATLPFDKHYRWRIAPSVGLRAQKDLERQQKRRNELRLECLQHIQAQSAQGSGPGEAEVDAALVQPMAQQVEHLNTFITNAMEALDEWNAERSEASRPLVETAA